ncbi:putative transferase acetyltransferase [Gloeomargarita lithophora Alchichica-D10]|uniref:Putative transferase acetyltransferase n=1 Tax=Gloeomargarita lithophora Alchichica-D10 TaxID=1188229 RepID=A0A1J0AG77_9CYAN|nr:putative transferase acetyltransferase [Gloeomargarita lithophora Alchichica-D10]
MFRQIKHRIKQSLRARLKEEVIRIVKDSFFADTYTIEKFEHCRFERNSLMRIFGGHVQLGENFVLGSFSQILVEQDATLIIGDHSWIANNCYIAPGEGCTISIGHRTTLQPRSQIIGDVTIGDDVLIAPNCLLSSGTHMYDYIPELKIREQDRKYCENNSNGYSNPIKIGNDCWLGVNSVILPGVTIGEGSVIGANAVVTKDVEPYSVVGGVPAKLIKKRLGEASQ